MSLFFPLLHQAFSDHLQDTPIMKALTIKQPWVHAILHEGKDIEIRSWQRSFRGWLGYPCVRPTHMRCCFSPWTACSRPRHFGLLRHLRRRPCGGDRDQELLKWFWRPDDGSTNYGWVLADVTALRNPSGARVLWSWEVSQEAFRELQRQLPELKFDA